MQDTHHTKAWNLCIILISSYIAEYLEDGFTRFLHDCTNTLYIKHDLSSGILASIIADTSINLMRNDNIIYSSFLGTGLIYAIISIYDEIINKKDIDYEKISYQFVYDGSFIVLIMFYYNKLLKYLKTYQKKNPNGIVFEVVKNLVNSLPISLYFGYRQFIQNLEENDLNKKDNKDNDKLTKK